MEFIVLNLTFREAPPTKNPSTSGFAANSLQFAPFTEPADKNDVRLRVASSVIQQCTRIEMHGPPLSINSRWCAQEEGQQVICDTNRASWGTINKIQFIQIMCFGFGQMPIPPYMILVDSATSALTLSLSHFLNSE